MVSIPVLLLIILGCNSSNREEISLSPDFGPCDSQVDVRLEDLRVGWGYILGFLISENEGRDDPVTAKDERMVLTTKFSVCTEPEREVIRVRLYRIEQDETFTEVAETTFRVDPCVPYKREEGWCLGHTPSPRD